MQDTSMVWSVVKKRKKKEKKKKSTHSATSAPCLFDASSGMKTWHHNRRKTAVRLDAEEHLGQKIPRLEFPDKEQFIFSSSNISRKDLNWQRQCYLHLLVFAYGHLMEHPAVSSPVTRTPGSRTIHQQKKYGGRKIHWKYLAWKISVDSREESANASNT